MRTVLEAVKPWHRPLMLMVLAMAGLTLTAAVGLVVDDRQIINESVWLKPFKFGIAFVLYGGTLAWLLSKLQKAKRFGWWTGTVFAVTGLVDVGFIAVQAARGTFSHFNANTDTFNQIGQQVFMSGVLGLFGASLVIAIMLLFQRVGDAALNRAIRIGLGLATAGMFIAFYLVGANGARDEVTDAYGHPVTLSGSHGIGVEDRRRSRWSWHAVDSLEHSWRRPADPALRRTARDPLPAADRAGAAPSRRAGGMDPSGARPGTPGGCGGVRLHRADGYRDRAGVPGAGRP
jgi:hypothetical protein